MKDRINLIVHCFDDIKKIPPEDVAYIFKLREAAAKSQGNWVETSYQENLAKLKTFCELEHLPNCVPMNSENSHLINFLLLKRLHRRILATNEGSGRTGFSNYEGLARFACGNLIVPNI